MIEIEVVAIRAQNGEATLKTDAFQVDGEALLRKKYVNSVPKIWLPIIKIQTSSADT